VTRNKHGHLPAQNFNDVPHIASFFYVYWSACRRQQAEHSGGQQLQKATF